MATLSTVAAVVAALARPVTEFAGAVWEVLAPCLYVILLGADAVL